MGAMQQGGTTVACMEELTAWGCLTRFSPSGALAVIWIDRVIGSPGISLPLIGR